MGNCNVVDGRTSTGTTARERSDAGRRIGEIETAVGRVLADLRALVGLTQAQVAERCPGVDRTELARWENGTMLWRWLPHVPSLAKVLGSQVNALAYRFLATDALREAMEVTHEALVTRALAEILDERAKADPTPSFEAPTVEEVAARAGIESPRDFVVENQLKYIVAETRFGGRRRFPR